MKGDDDFNAPCDCGAGFVEPGHIVCRSCWFAADRALRRRVTDARTGAKNRARKAKTTVRTELHSDADYIAAARTLRGFAAGRQR